MKAERRIGWARGIGFVVGVAIAITAVLGWRLPRGTGRLGADVVMAFLQTGELHVSSTSPLVSATSLHPGGSSDGSVDVRNIGARTLSVSVEAQPSIHDLDDIVWVRLTAGGEQIFRGTLGDLRGGSHAFTIEAQDERTLGVRTWMPSSTTAGYEGRIDQVNLLLDARAAS